MINKQIFQFPVQYTSRINKLAIGWGVHETVADECHEAGIKNALLVTSGLKGTGIVDQINQILTTQGVSTVIYDKVTSNPKDHEVMEAYQVFKETGCDGVVSIGGGSSHDTGKGVRAVSANDGIYVCDMAMFIDPPWMEECKKYKPVTVPQITVNTTAGTGAENTSCGVITNTKARAKQLINLPGMAPIAALIDPLLIRLMPQNIAAWTGFDALTHAFESYISRVQCKHSSALFIGTMKLVSENLREFAHNRMNHTACENMCWAESMAGVGISLGAGGGIVHGLAHQISALTGAHHGLANAVMAIACERYNESACPEKFGEMVRAMGVDTTGLTTIQAADRWFVKIERLLADLNIKSGHLNEQFGLQKKDFEHIVNIYSNDWCCEGNPKAFNFEECMEILESVF
jgi:alcohol dehydrogenase class IV